VQVMDCFHGAEATLAVWEHRLDDARAAITTASQTITRRDPSYAAPLCSIGMRLEAEVAATARVHRSMDALEAAIEAGERLLEEARAHARAPIPEARANEAMCRGELSRLQGRSDPRLWEEAVRRWEAIGCSYWTSYSRWRQAEALLRARSRRGPPPIC